MGLILLGLVVILIIQFSHQPANKDSQPKQNPKEMAIILLVTGALLGLGYAIKHGLLN
ncbi:hypothetical protein [Pontibacter sp. G13]|uniref:hypothetical protein n=1 Tax=Pontibacter sp. G13 TaxID=3074898 RepID=UPI00288B5F10|nr:hypothetical protein [Pontibacter sp. G13]WNJ17229.1 hypothetical protein RJD25_20425 [Pontibacter sp. G13]